MLIYDKKEFTKGCILLITFAIVLTIFFSPVFPNEQDNTKKENGLAYIDNIFNSLAKGSSNFFTQVHSAVAKLPTTPMSATFKEERTKGRTALVIELAEKANMQITRNPNATITVAGNFQTLLATAANDSEYMFYNNGTALETKYNKPPLEVMYGWDLLLNALTLPLKRDKHIADAKHITLVIKKAVEPGYNFYKIESIKVSDHALLLISALIFYVVYTLWYGFGIMHIFQGLGLAMTKSKVKSEH